MTIEPETGTYRTAVPPNHLELQVPASVQATAGEPVEIPHSVTTVGHRPDRPARIIAKVPGRLRSHGDTTHTVPFVGGGVTGRFVVEAPSGQHVVRVSLDGGYNSPTGFVAITATAPSQVDAPRLAAGGGLLLLAVGLARLRRRRNKD